MSFMHSLFSTNCGAQCSDTLECVVYRHTGETSDKKIGGESESAILLLCNTLISKVCVFVCIIRHTGADLLHYTDL